MKKEEFIFCPLGGSGEIGMNMNLFAYGNQENRKWIIVDIGVTFADDSIPGVDLISPDPGFIVERKDNLLGIVLTQHIEQVEFPICCALVGPAGVGKSTFSINILF